MPLGYGGSGALCFMLQEGDYLGDGRTVFPYGITRGATSDKPPQLIWRVLSYIWVDYSFTADAPLLQQPISKAGLFVGPLNLMSAREAERVLGPDVI
jgi:hypothetical protein